MINPLCEGRYVGRADDGPSWQWGGCVVVAGANRTGRTYLRLSYYAVMMGRDHVESIRDAMERKRLPKVKSTRKPGAQQVIDLHILVK